MTEETRTESDPPKKAQVLRKSARWRPSMVWGVPIMALLLGAMLILQTYREQGPTIEIGFPFAAGLKADATPIKYLEVEIGRLTEVRLNDTLDGVVVVAEIDPDAESFLREGTVFWLVRPQITMAGITAIETLLSGQYIEVIPSETGKHVTKFDGRLRPPVGARYPNGKSIILETARLGSIAQGTPVFHRNLRVGEVEHYELGEGGAPIRIFTVIDEDFADRVHEDSLFWNASGIDAHVGLDGVDIRTEGLAAVLGGGIAFSSPEGPSPGSPAGASFPLYIGADAAQQAQLRSQSLELRIESRDGQDLGDGTPIYYRNIQIGHIGESWITPDARAVRAEAFIESRFRPLMKEGTRFYKTSGVDVSFGLDGLEVRSGPLRSIVSGGISIATPASTGTPAPPLHLFALHQEPKNAWLAWRPTIELESARDGEADGHRLPPSPDAGALDLILHAKEIGSVTLNSQVTYRRFPVGRVIEHDLALDGQSVDVRIRIDAEYRNLVGSSTRFWRPAGFSVDAGLGGVELEFDSLRTLAAGAIAFDNPLGRGDAVTPLDRFALHADEAMALQDVRESQFRTFFVESAESNLTAGAPVYYRKYEIGQVGRSALTADAQGVRVELHIGLEYAPLVRMNTRFWSPAALSMRGDLSGIELDVAPLQTMLVGGVMLATPTEAEAEAPETSVYRLEATAPAGSDGWRPRLMLSEGVLTAFDDFAERPRALRILLEATHVDSIHDGDPIFYRGLQVGSVSARTLALDGRHVVLTAAIEAEYASLIRGNTEFWNASGIEVDVGLTGIEVETGPLETFVQGGIQLATPDPAAAPAAEGDRFVLRLSPDDDWREWSPVLQ